MESETRRTRQRQELVDDVVSEARRRLEEGGPSAVTLRGIAREVGVTAPALYTYFPSLAELFTELIVQSYRGLENSVASALDAAADLSLDERLAAGPIAYRRWAVQHRQQFNLVFFDQIAGYAAPADGPTVDAQTAVLRPIAAEYAAARGRGIDDVLGDDELLDGFLAWWGAFHGIVALEVNHHLDWRDPETIFLRHLTASIQQIRSPDDS
jgi:AcrR family transcriptional regulator